MSNLSPFSGSSNPTPNASLTHPVPSFNDKVRMAPPKPKRKRINTAEKRSQHNAVERARRETLNGKFIHLARLLPSLAASRRPSKAAIVNGSIKHLETTRAQRLLAANTLRQVIAERDQLLAENNRFRAQSGMSPLSVSNVQRDLADICSVEAEQFGTFAGMDGENDEEDDSGEADAFEATFSGLITPRSAGSEFAAQLFAPTPAAAPAPNPNVWTQDFAFTAPAYQSDVDRRSLSGSPSRLLTPESGLIREKSPPHQQINANAALWHHMQAQQAQLAAAQADPAGWVHEYANSLPQLSPAMLSQWTKTAYHSAQENNASLGLDLQLGAGSFWPFKNAVEGY